MTTKASPPSAAEAPRPAAPLSLRLHAELASAHDLHGAARGDYAQYGAYCTRRLSRLRHGKAARRELLRCRMYKGSASTKVSEEELGGGGGGGGGGSKARHAYRAIDLTNLSAEALATSPNYFWEPLYSAERCWAASMAVKAEGGSGGGGGGGGGSAILGGGGRRELTPGKVRARAIKRLRKAAKFATLLEDLATSAKKSAPKDGREEGTGDAVDADGEEAPLPPTDERTRAEVRAYASWMRGNLALERSQWGAACEEYRTALALCEALAADVVGDLELADFFAARAKNAIAPLLRYCQYELQEKGMSPTEKISFLQSSSTVSDAPNDPLQSKLHSLKAETLQNQATTGSSMSQIVFRENTIVVETRELRMALLKVQDLRSDWEEDKKGSVSNNNGNGNSSSGDAKFMELLNAYDDAVSLANQELKQLASLKSGPAVNAKRFQLVNVLGYCRHQKLRLVMGRNEGLADDIVRRNKRRGLSPKHLEEVAHLYDALLQDARAVAALPGGGSPDDLANGDDAPPTEDEFLLEANANVLRLRALRCYYLARMHAAPTVWKYPEALALLDQAEGLAQEAAEEIGACDGMEGGEEMLESLEGVLEELRGEKCRVLAESVLGKGRASTAGKPLLERLYDYDVPPPTASSIACVPPKLEPMACKPSFFDVALNYVSEYPLEELNQALEEHDRGKSTASKGFLGWFRR